MMWYGPGMNGWGFVLMTAGSALAAPTGDDTGEQENG